MVMEGSSPVLAPQQRQAPASSGVPNICSPGCPFPCSEKPPDPRVGCAAMSQGLCDPPCVLAGLWWAQQDDAFGRAAYSTVRAALGTQVKPQLRKFH